MQIFTIQMDVVEQILAAMQSVTPFHGIRNIALDPHSGVSSSSPAGPELTGSTGTFVDPAFPLPTKEALGRIIQVALQASQFIEEGRPALFRLAITDSGTLPNNVVRLLNPLPLDTVHIGRLAMCVDPKKGMLVIDPAGTNIWGLAHVVGTSDWHQVILTISRPGCMAIKFWGHEVARFMELDVRFIAKAHVDKYAAEDAVVRALELTGTLPECYGTADTILQIAAAIQKKGHGGTLLVADQPQKLSQKYPLQPFVVRPPPPAELPAGVPEELRRAFDANYSLEIAANVNVVAGLSQTDGAIWLKRDLTVQAFGCFIEDGATAIEVGEISGFDLTKKPRAASKEIGGARHQSAIAFVHANEQSIAFVASQDGSLSMIVRTDKDGVVVIRPIVLPA